MTAPTEVRVPDIGAFEDVQIIEVHVRAGDRVREEDPLITLESEKATMELPAPLAGQARGIGVKVGDPVCAGTLILTVGPGDGAVAGAVTQTEPVTQAGQQQPGVSAAAPPAAPAHAAEAPAPRPGFAGAHPTLSETTALAAEAFEGTITDLYLPKKKKALSHWRLSCLVR